MKKSEIKAENETLKSIIDELRKDLKSTSENALKNHQLYYKYKEENIKLKNQFESVQQELSRYMSNYIELSNAAGQVKMQNKELNQRILNQSESIAQLREENESLKKTHVFVHTSNNENETYFPFILSDGKFRYLFAVQSKPETKYIFKDKEVTLEQLINILNRAEIYPKTLLKSDKDKEIERLSKELKWATEKLRKDFNDRGYFDFEKENIALKQQIESAKDFWKDEVIFLKGKLDELSKENREIKHKNLLLITGVEPEAFQRGYQQAQVDYKYMQKNYNKKWWRIFK